jgi:hypothetical protein
LNIGTSDTGTVSIGGATYPVSIGGDLGLGAGTNIFSTTAPSNTIQMDVDWDGDPSIIVGDPTNGRLQVGGGVLLQSGDAANLLITDTADFNTDLYLKRDAGNGTLPRSINTRSNLGLNIGNVSGTVSVGNATYPVSIKGDLNIATAKKITQVNGELILGSAGYDYVIAKPEASSNSYLYIPSQANVVAGDNIVLGWVDATTSHFNDGIIMGTYSTQVLGGIVTLDSDAGVDFKVGLKVAGIDSTGLVMETGKSITSPIVSLSSYIDNTLGTGRLEIKTGGTYGDGWELNTDNGAYTGSQLTIRDTYNALANYNAGGFVAMYGTNGKLFEIQNAGAELMYMNNPVGNIYLESNTQILLNCGLGGQIKITPTEIIVNDDASSVDFRVEGDTEPNLLFTDGSTDRVGVGTNTPSVELDVVGDTKVSGVFQVGEYTVGTLPATASYQSGVINVSDETGGYTMAFCDGINWRRVQDRAIVS